MYNAEVLLDSLNPLGIRLTTMAVTMPRFILAEFNTHRVFSRNAASSRAIPVSKRIEQVLDHPFIPAVFGKNQKGMQSIEGLDPDAAEKSKIAWEEAIRDAVWAAQELMELGVHKQLANRILEPFVWVEVIVSSTMWDNFFSQRISPLAQPEMQEVASRMKSALDASTPTVLQWGQWHSPLHENRDVAVGRIARVSYDGAFKNSPNDDADILLGERLQKDGHWSPFEHIAQARNDLNTRNYGPGWVQWRAILDGQ